MDTKFVNVQIGAILGLVLIVTGFLWSKIGSRGLALLSLILIVAGLIGAVLIATMLGGIEAMTGTTLVATVIATPISNQAHEMAISLVTYDHDGVSHQAAYQLAGDRWELDADVIELEPWLNALGIKNGFALARLTSEFDDNQAHTVQPVALVNGTPSFSLPFVVRSHERAGVLEPADGVTYHIYCTIKGSMYAVHA